MKLVRLSIQMAVSLLMCVREYFICFIYYVLINMYCKFNLNPAFKCIFEQSYWMFVAVHITYVYVLHMDTSLLFQTFSNRIRLSLSLKIP